MKTFIKWILVFYYIQTTVLSALTVDDSKIANKDYFGIEFPNGTLFVAKHAKINSVSEQVYLLNGLIIKEISIDFENSDSLLRIYNMRAPEAKDMAGMVKSSLPKADSKQATSVFDSAYNRMDKLESEIKKQTEYSKVVDGADTVTKVYPSTTHAKTIEYAVANEAELDTFHATIIRDLTKYESEEKESVGSTPKIAGRLYIFQNDKEEK